MMTGSEEIYDVVFIVEATAAMSPYFHELRQAYIEPSLEKLGGGLPEDVDYGFDYSCSLYSLVTFYSSDILPAPSFHTIAPTSSTFEILKWMDQIEFVGGCGEGRGHVAEGLGAALQLFDELNSFRENCVKTKKICVLVCNSPPYDLPCQSASGYMDYTAEALCSMMGERGILLSVFSPKKIPTLSRLFNRAGWDQTIPMKDYTKDARHLVLLNGYQLQERPPSPVDKKDLDKSILKAASPAGSVLTNSPKTGSQGVSKPVDGQFKVPTSANTSQISNPVSMSANIRQPMNPGIRQMGPRAPGAINPRMPQPNTPQETAKLILEEASKPSSIGQTIGQVPSPKQGGIPQQRAPRPGLPTSHGQMISQPSQMTSQAQLMMNQQKMAPNVANNARMQRFNAPQQQLNQQQVNPQMNQQQINQQQQMNQQQMNPQQQLMMQQQQPKREIKMIWRGVLEWQDKKQTNTNTVKQTKSLQCEVFALSSGENDIDTSRWKNNLIMQLIPQQLLSQLHSLIKQSRNVEFKFAQNDQETLVNLQRVMSSGFAGCVHFPMQSQCDIRVLLLLYSLKKDQFIGMIPNDQTRFVEGIRTVITNHKHAQQQKQLLAQQQQQQPHGLPQPQMSGVQPMDQGQTGQMSGDSDVERRSNLQKMRSLEQEMEALKQKELQFQADQKTQQIKAIEAERQRQQMFQMQQQQQQQQPRMMTDQNAQLPGQNQQLRHLLMSQQQQQQQQQQSQNQFRQQQFMMQQQQRHRAAAQPMMGQQQMGQIRPQMGNMPMQMQQGQQFMGQDEFVLDNILQ